ncbi:hypothetical protein C7212DRAFT_302097 [Tuber magnatum]|uniref:Choice-of-anchor B family protein n=1 Tax=Tuber magnatum TaxID=42249 RepID=A0A317SD62_9PEZI|nr:hypothetical protein C7212DRAFT_302097 [Tuber magnatum]
MKSLITVGLLLLATAPLSREKPVDQGTHAMYVSGAVMETILRAKEAAWDDLERKGYFAAGTWESHNYYKACGEDGIIQLGRGANHSHQCFNLDLTGHLTHGDLGSAGNDSTRRVGSSIWGITLEGREFAIIGQADGAAFAEVVGRGWWNWVPFFGKAEGTLDYLGRLPQQTLPSWWREIKTYKHYAIIGSEAIGHGVQIFDLRKIVDIRTRWNPLSRATKTFSVTTDLTGWFNDLPVGRSHNVVIAEASDHVIAVGAQPRNDTCASGLIFIDVSDPSKPKKTGCASGDGYVHDAQCLIYQGPHTKYVGKEICYGYNEDSLTIYDITDKTTTTIISRTSYEGVNYTHQGWVLDEKDQRFLLLDDELDEVRRVGPAADQHATTYIWDISNLEKPIQSGIYKSEAISIDHNQYVHKGYTYQSNYGSGLRVLDITSIPLDPTGACVREVAYFDVFPDDDNSQNVSFVGTWGSYAYFESGHIIVNTIDRGVFVVKRSKEVKGGFRAEF